MTDLREIMQRQSRGDEVIVLPRKAADDLRAFLMGRESDIMWGIEDFDKLRGLFAAFIGRPAEEENVP